MVATRNISFLYDVGQTVYLRVMKNRQVPVQCAICSSTGEVSISGKVFTCPECHGAKNTEEEMVASVEEATVIRVLASKCSARGCRVRYEITFRRSTRMVEESELYASEADALPAQDQ